MKKKPKLQSMSAEAGEMARECGLCLRLQPGFIAA
jgi:hypothetical protein